MSGTAPDSIAVGEVPGVVDSLRLTFSSGRTKPLAWRKKQLQRVIDLVKENREAILSAVSQDLGSNPVLVNYAETGATIQEAELALESLDKWTAPEVQSTPLTVKPATGYIVREPYGVALLIGPWNYPFRLVMLPLIGAIAAGNCVLIKPSEVSVRASQVIHDLVHKYLDTDAIRVVQGGVPLTTEILRQKFDYIFYTGNTEVGRIVMRAAAENLTPNTLELGGKSPVIVDDQANIKVTANRIINGKCMNSGQTCVAADYVLVTRSKKDELVAALKDSIKEFFGPDPMQSESYSRIINERHARRIQSYLAELEQDRIIYGGKVVPEQRYVEPTLVDEPPLDSKIMKDEIFGPLLPIISVKDVDEAINFVNSRPKPLALYVFSENKETTNKVISNTSSGGVGSNVTIFHIGIPTMPFGGVGPSGMGAYNGKYTFDTFTHRKSVLHKPTWLDPKALYPPYTPDKVKAMNAIADGVKMPASIKYGIPAALVGLALIARNSRL